MNAIIALAVIGAVLGFILAIASIFLTVQDDERKEVVAKMLPGANCGGCGYPGCSGLADALVEGKTNKVSTCVVANQKIKEEIMNYLNETPDSEGNTLHVVI